VRKFDKIYLITTNGTIFAKLMQIQNIFLNLTYE